MWKYHTSPNGKIITVLFVKLYGSRNIQTQWADDGLSRYKYMYIRNEMYFCLCNWCKYIYIYISANATVGWHHSDRWATRVTHRIYVESPKSIWWIFLLRCTYVSRIHIVWHSRHVPMLQIDFCLVSVLFYSRKSTFFNWRIYNTYYL